jgi:hypothetical protein
MGKESWDGAHLHSVRDLQLRLWHAELLLFLGLKRLRSRVDSISGGSRPMTTDVSSIQSLYLSSPLATTSPQGAGQSGNVSPAASVSMSQSGQLWSELQSLAQSDPSEFEQVTASIASQLTSAASSMTGQQASFVSNLAQSFQEASQTGSMSSLEPPASQGQTQGQGQAQGHGHHHHHGHGASGSTQSSTSAQSSSDSLFQQIESIISNALSSATGSTTSSTNSST